MNAEERYGKACDGIQAAKTSCELRDALGAVLPFYGLSHFVYHAVRLPGATGPQPVLIWSYPSDWAARYNEMGYFGIDPVVAAGMVAFLPVDWARLDRRGFHASRLFGDANKFGIGRQGMTFPIRGALGDQALFSVACDVTDAEWAHQKRIFMRDFQMIAHLVHGRVLELHGELSPAVANVLSPRERECLQWAARGKTNKGIARELTISERVVRAYFETSRHKLNCLNRSHVVSRALSLQLIQPVIN